MATVAELIEHLRQFPQGAQVAFQKYSEQCLLDLDTVCLAECCEARPDGWIQNARPDMPVVEYVMFPGN